MPKKQPELNTDLLTAQDPKPDPMQIWDRVWQTDPNFTKHVNQRGGFTAICAYYQFRRATELWGPVGGEWGWEQPIFEIVGEGNMALLVCHVVLFYKHGYKIRLVSSIRLYNKDGKVDDDAYKKVLTDALTKGLSYLGFSADVFLGMFDDSKYVEQRRAEVAAENDGNGDGEFGDTPTAPINEINDDWSCKQRVEQLRKQLGFTGDDIVDMVFETHICKFSEVNDNGQAEIVRDLETRLKLFKMFIALATQQSPGMTTEAIFKQVHAYLIDKAEPWGRRPLRALLSNWQAWLNDVKVEAEKKAHG